MTVQYQGVWSLQSAAQLQSTQRWVTDPLYKNTTLLLQADDAANGAQNNTFLDSSSNAFAITRNPASGPNAPTQGSFTPFSSQPGAWGNFFDGSNSFIQRTSPPAGITNWTGTNWTLEYWIYANAFGSSANTGSNVFGNTNDSGPSEYWSFGPISTGAVRWYYFTGASPTITTTTTLATGRWYHLAFVNNGGNLTIYIDGVSSATGTIIGTPQFGSAVAVTLGKNTGSSFNGYVSNLRITQSAVYTANFTPSALPLTAISGTQLLMCQSNRFVDNSTNAIVFTPSGTPSVQAFSPFAPQFQWTPSVIGGSGYFDGTGDYLSVASNTALTFGTGDFTVEGWFYANALGGQPTILNNGSDAAGLVITTVSSKIYAYFVGAGNVFGSGGATIVTNTWYHFAWVRSGSTHTFYLNGAVYGATYSSAGNHASTGGVGIGYSVAGTVFAAWNGYIANVRMVKGTAVYTGAFTPPIAPVTTSGPASSYSSTTNVNTTFTSTNTSLLTNFTNAGIVDATMKNNLETVGNAQISTAVVKYGSGSMYFDGSGDYLTSYNVGGLFRLGPVYTVEMWFYTTTVAAGNAGLINFATTISGNTGFNLYRSSAEILCNDGATGGTGPSSGAGSVVANVWTHLAVVSNGVTTKVYLDGVERGSFTGTTGSANTMLYVTIGSFNDKSSPFSGYIDDLRVTRGIARYTQNFIPPSVALPRQ